MKKVNIEKLVKKCLKGSFTGRKKITEEELGKEFGLYVQVFPQEDRTYVVEWDFDDVYWRQGGSFSCIWGETPYRKVSSKHLETFLKRLFCLFRNGRYYWSHTTRPGEILEGEGAGV